VLMLGGVVFKLPPTLVTLPSQLPVLLLDISGMVLDVLAARHD
jgi:hypothetical protein